LAKKAIEEEKYQDAIDLLKRTETYPENLGEGKLYGTQENDIHYWLGCAYEGLGENEKAVSAYRSVVLFKSHFYFEN